MKFVVVDPKPGVAGHSRDAFSIARALSDSGHKVTILYPTPLSECCFYKYQSVQLLEVEYDGDYARPLSNRLKEIHLEEKYDGVFVFDFIFEKIFNKDFENIDLKFVGIKCAGPSRTVRPVYNSLVSFGQEFMDGCLKNTDIAEHQISYTPARIWNCRSIYIDCTDESKIPPQIHKLTNISKKHKLVVSVSRIGGDYAESIIVNLLAIARLYRMGHKISYVHVGYVEAIKFEKIRSLFTCLNEKIGETIAVCDSEYANDPDEIVKHGEIRCGSGRSAVEGLLMKQKVIITGQTGSPECVTKESFDRLVEHNLTTRSTPTASVEEKIDSLTVSLQKFLSGEENEVHEEIWEKTVATFEATLAIPFLEAALQNNWSNLVKPDAMSLLLIWSSCIRAAKKIFRKPYRMIFPVTKKHASNDQLQVLVDFFYAELNKTVKKS